MYLLDTNVASDIQKRLPKPTAWVVSVDPETIYLSVISIGEIERGITKLRKHDGERANRLATWLHGLRRDNADRILPVTEEIALLWGQMTADRSRGSADSLIAATARVHNLIMVTRNEADFEEFGVAVLNPWTS